MPYIAWSCFKPCGPSGPEEEPLLRLPGAKRRGGVGDLLWGVPKVIGALVMWRKP